MGKNHRPKKPKAAKKEQAISKAEASKKAEIDKLVQQAKAVKQPKKQVPVYRPVKQRPQQPACEVEAPFTRDEAVPIDLSNVAGQIVICLPTNEVRQPVNSKTPFPFLRLPQELQNQVYGYLFDHPLTFHVKFVSHRKFGRKALTYRLPNQPAEAQPKVDETVWLRRRRLDYPRRVRSTETDIPPYKIPTGFLSLFHVHPRIAAGAAQFFYRLHTFRFTGMRALRTFMDMIAPSSKEAIRNLEISHHTYGFGWTPNRIWKAKADDYYELTLWRVGIEMTGLRTLKLNLRVNDIPVDFGPEVAWRKPFEALWDMDLSRVKIKVDTLLIEYKDAMEVESYLIEQELLAEQYRDGGCNAVERRSDKEVPEKLLPCVKRYPCKVLNITIPGYPRRS